MNTGTWRRPHSSQIRIELRVVDGQPGPVRFVVESPRPFPISPTPTAPAAMSACSCLIAFSDHPATPRKSIPASTLTRSLYCVPRIVSIVR